MKIVIPVYKEMSWILPIYMHFHNKFWDENVTILGEELYLKGEKNVTPIGLKFVAHETTPSDLFSDVLIWYLQQIEDNQVIIMLGDYLIKNPVNIPMINKIIDYMDNDHSVLRCQLGDFTIGASKLHIENFKGIDIYERGFHPTNLTPGIWNRKLLLKLLEPYWTAWDVEHHLEDRYLMSNMRSVCPMPEPIQYINAIRSRDNGYLVINKELKNEIQDLIPSNIKIWETERNLADGLDD